MAPFFTLLTLSIVGQVLAAPVAETENIGLIAGTPTLKVDVNNWQDIAELDCYAILCDYNGEKKWQKAVGGVKAAEDHYTESGAKLGPFKDTTLRKTSVIKQGFISPEEFPWRSMEKGGTGARLFPVDGKQQSRQGGTISGAYKTAKIKDGDYFELEFTNFSPTSVYCKALFKTTPDKSVCKDKKKTDVFGQSIFPGDYDYTKDPRSSSPITFKH